MLVPAEHQAADRTIELERQIADLKTSLDVERDEKERRVKDLEDELAYLRTSFEAADLARHSIEQEMSQLPTW